MSEEIDKESSKDDYQYKLYYFNGNGKAVIIRAILYYSKVKFNDIKIRLSLAQLEKFKIVKKNIQKLFFQT